MKYPIYPSKCLWMKNKNKKNLETNIRYSFYRQIVVIMIPNKYYKNPCGNDQSDETEIS